MDEPPNTDLNAAQGLISQLTQEVEGLRGEKSELEVRINRSCEPAPRAG